MRLMHFMEICSDLLAYGYVFVFLCMICAFLPMRRNWFLRIVGIVLVFCPAMIAVNYLMEETGRKIFFALTNAPASPTEDGWTCEQHLAVCA